MDLFDNVHGVFAQLGISAPVVGVIVLALLVWQRTKSTHSLMTRLWTLFHGGAKCHERKLGDLFDQQSDLMRFRFIAGVRARTHSQMLKVIEFCQRENENVETIAAVGHHFDLEHVELKKNLPPRWWTYIEFVWSMALAMFCVTLVVLALQNQALLKMNKSGRLFFLSNDSARTFPAKGAGISRKACVSHEPLANSGFSSEDNVIVCEAFGDKDLSKYIDESIRSQRYIFGFGILILSLLCWVAGASVLQASRARAMKARLEARRRGDHEEQMNAPRISAEAKVLQV